MKKRLEVVISGVVQGVFFRAFIRDKAKELVLTGFVRNNAYGSVNAVFEGEEEKLKKMLDLCKLGSRHSKVEKVSEKWSSSKEEFHDFKISY